MTTLKDVAASAGVAVSTVSRALNRSGYVEAQTYDRIVQVARELGYRPNVLARGLRSQRTGTYGFVIPDLRNQFYADASSVLHETVRLSGGHLVVGVSHDDPATEIQCLEAFEAQQVDGVVLIPTLLPAAQRERFTFPIVELNRVSGSATSDTVVADDEDGVHRLTQQLIDAGHRDVALIVGDLETSTGHDRHAGFFSAVTASGLSAENVHVGSYTSEWGRQAAVDVLSSAVTGVVIASSQIMEGFIEVCRDRGVSMPEDLSVVAYGDPPWYRLWAPAITTFAPDLATMGRVAGEWIIDRANRDEAPSEPRQSVVPGDLIVRESVVGPRASEGRSPASL